MSVSARVMMTRSLLHAAATGIAICLAYFFAGADMRMRIATYVLGWIVCGAAYLQRFTANSA